jgi:hypothetical protein
MSDRARGRWLAVAASLAVVLGVLAPFAFDRPDAASAVVGSQFNPSTRNGRETWSATR